MAVAIMGNSQLETALNALASEGRKVFMDIRGLVVSLGAAIRTRSKEPIIQWFREDSVVDPIRFKRILIRLLKILVVIELVSAFFDGFANRDWSRFGIDLVIAGVLYVAWDRIMTTVRNTKEEYRKKMETAPQAIRLWDALIFSLLWSDEIYGEIPADRRRLVVISYTLIALGLIAAFLKIGSGLMVLVISGALVLGAVNLATWVISLERTEKETLQTELRIAHDVQVALMPKEHPTLPGFEIAGMSVPAREVGGDHFDYSRPGGEDGKFGISIVDVSGKGMQAAMSAVFTSGAFASESKQSASPAEILTRLNKSVYLHSKRGHFVAFLLAVLEPGAKRLTFANAGQTKPLVRSGTTIRWLDSVGVHFPLGMQADSVYEEQTVALQSGDILFLLTDGFTEAMNARQELYGTDRIEQALRQPGLEQLNAERLLDHLTNNVRNYVHDAPQHDDMTMVVVKVL
jgi:serine phosphatase RsbU (regulator of sigma subunit)